MKAVYAAGTDYDNPLSQLKVGELDTPETKPFWSTIHVAAASVNHHDIWSLQGVGLSAEQTPMILGTDASGVLDEDIPVRKGLKAGAEVVLYTFVGTDGAGVMPGSGAPSYPKNTRAPWPKPPKCPAPTCSPNPPT